MFKANESETPVLPECIPESFEFAAHGSRQVVARLHGGR